MAKILISTLPVLGHIKPALAAAKKLKAVGHELIFALPEDKNKRALIEERGFSFIRTNDDVFLYEPVTIRFDPRFFVQDIEKIERNMWAVLAIWTCSQIDQLRNIVDEHCPNFIISDCLHIAPLLVAKEKRQPIPSAVLGVTPYRHLFRGSGPLGLGWAPTNNYLLASFYDRVNRTIDWRFRTLRERVAKCLSIASPITANVLAPRSASAFSVCQELGDAYLQCSSPCLEDNVDQLQKNNVEFIGPMNDEPLSPDLHLRPPAFQTESQRQAKRPTILITWGTMQASPPQEFLSAAREFVWSSEFNVIVAPPANHKDGVELELRPEVTSGLLVITKGFDDLIPKLKCADVFVSNGGFGAVKAALTLGVPVVCAGNQDDKPDVCGRVKRSGAGIGLPWCTEHRTIIETVHRVLEDKSFAARARTVGFELSEADKSGRLEKIVDRFLQPAAVGTA